MQDDHASDPHARLGEYILPGDARVANCKSCQAQIVWAKTRTGAAIPLSLSTVRLGADGHRWALSHFVDCPMAAQHRKPAGQAIDLRDLPEYMERNHLVVTGSTLSDNGKGQLTIVLQTRKA